MLSDEDIFKIKAIENFQTERPYGIRIDYKQKKFALFNRHLNELGCEAPFDICNLKMEYCPFIDDIPTEGEEVIQEDDNVICVFYYNDATNPYDQGVLNMAKLQKYNQRIYQVCNFLDRSL